MEVTQRIIFEEGENNFYEVINGIPERRTMAWFKEHYQKGLIKPIGWKEVALANGRLQEGYCYERISGNEQ